MGAAGTIRARNRKWEGSLGDESVYTRSRWEAKMEIPDGTEVPAQPAPSLVILAIDDDPGMLRFYNAALTSEHVRVESVDGSTSWGGIGGNPQS